MLIGFICVALAATCLGLMPTFQKELLVGGLPMGSLMFFTNWVITLFALSAALIKKRSLKAKAVQWIQAVCMGVVGLLITAVLLNTSYYYLPVGTSIMLNFLYPTIVCLIMGVVFKDGFTRYQVIAILLSIVGMVFLTGVGGQMDPKGLMLAIASAFTYGIYLVANEKGPANDLSIEVKLFYVSLPGTLYFTSKALLDQSLATPDSAAGWVMMIAGSGLFTVGGYFLMMYGIDKMGAATASFVSMLEPIVSVVFSTIWFHDPVTLGIAAGGGLVLCSILFITIDGYKKASA